MTARPPDERRPSAPLPRSDRPRRRVLVAAIAVLLILIVAGGAWGISRATSGGAGSPTSAPATAVPSASSSTSGAITISNRSNVTIQGRTFSGIAGRPAIVIENSTHVVIADNVFLNDSEPILVTSSTDVTITGNRYRNITGPHERNGSHRGNFTQWVNSTGGSIDHNVGQGGDTEDIISIYHSGGADQAHPLVISDNVLVGTDWTSSSGSGILVGDNGSSHVLVRDNTLVTPGQVGIGVAGGTDITVTGNTVSGTARPHSNVGIYVWNLSGQPCSGITVSRNTVQFQNAAGASSPLYDGGGCGAVAGWDTNSTK